MAQILKKWKSEQTYGIIKGCNNEDQQNQLIEFISYILNSEMEQLNRLIKDASNQFQCHNFQTSLSLYVRCIRKVQEQKLPQYILHNLKSSEAALRAILGEQQAAMAILNNILSQNKQHWLSLLRRSQIYKKQNKYKKALKDLDILSMYAPDNMQVAALKLQIKSLKSKNGNSSSESESDSGEESIDQEKVLQFSNLKKIDRTSISIMLPKGRSSRVSMGGDKAFYYQSEGQTKRQSINFNHHFIRKKFIQVQQELEVQSNIQQSQQPAIVIKSAPSRNKSILKNRNSKIYFQQPTQNLISTQQGRKLINRLQNIQGQIISSEHGSEKDNSCKEVQFKKSLNSEDPERNEIPTVKKKPAGRKSCLKRSSFSVNGQQTPKIGRRGSKFQNLTRSSIDGKMIKGQTKKKQQNKQNQKQNNYKNGVDSGDESQIGSHFNIFGSKKLDINKQLRQNLGLGSDEIIQSQQSAKIKPKKRGDSILKKTSILVKKQTNKTKKTSVFFKDNSEQQQIKEEKKAKKSVMFRTC